MVTKNTTCFYSHANQIYLFTLGHLICWFFRFLKLCSFQNSFSSTVTALSKNWSAGWLPGYNMVILLLILHSRGIPSISVLFTFLYCFFQLLMHFSSDMTLIVIPKVEKMGRLKLDLHQKLLELFFLSCFITCKINSCCVLDTNKS